MMSVYLVANILVAVSDAIVTEFLVAVYDAEWSYRLERSVPALEAKYRVESSSDILAFLDCEELDNLKEAIKEDRKNSYYDDYDNDTYEQGIDEMFEAGKEILAQEKWEEEQSIDVFAEVNSVQLSTVMLKAETIQSSFDKLNK